jgi:hypothetical protein
VIAFLRVKRECEVLGGQDEADFIPLQHLTGGDVFY